MLTPADFDVAMKTKDQLDADRKLVEADINAMVGWGANGASPGSMSQQEVYNPKSYFAAMKSKLEAKEVCLCLCLLKPSTINQMRLVV